MKAHTRTLCGYRPRAWAEWVGAGKARFHYPCGYSCVRYVIRGAKKRRHVSDAMLERMARWWGKENGGVNDVCPKCERTARSATS